MKKILNIISLTVLLFTPVFSYGTAEKLDAFIEKVTLTIQENDTDSFNNLFNMNIYADRIIEQLDYNDRTKKEYKKIFLKEKDKLINNIFLQTFYNGDAQIKFKKTEIRDRRKSLNYRVIGPDSAVIFIEMILAKGKNNNYEIIDFYTLDSGDYLSNVASQAILLMDPKRNVFESFLDISKVDSKIIDNFLTLSKNYRNGQYNKAYLSYLQLPIEFKKEPVIARLGTQITINLSDDIYLKHLSFIDENFSNDPSFSMALIDYHFMNDDLDSAIKNLHLLNDTVGSDAYVLHLISTTYGLLNDFGNQLTFAQQAIDLEPELLYAHFALLDYYIMSADYVNAIKTLIVLNKQFDDYVLKSDLIAEPSYAGFVNSEVFKLHFAE
ncbi:MAG: hypothetical protein HRU38_08780 [Saccharospirillaceae bacterium]|nr:hypothetical protein [Pseudomonadales bacterium]NRB78748.1 hypothetical protein [Saccharospirillaceae bacterium]